MGQNVWIIDIPAHEEVSTSEKHYYEYNWQPFKLTLQGIEFGTIEKGEEVSKVQSGMRATALNNMIILASMAAWSFGKGGGKETLTGLGNLAGLLK